MEQPKLPEVIDRWLDALPGGQWIRPHYFDGPYSLVPLSVNEKPHTWSLIAVFEAHPPLATCTLVGPGDYVQKMTVHAMPAYAAATVMWEVDESFQVIDEFFTNTYDATPTLTDLVAAILEEYGIEPERVADIGEGNLHSFLTVLSGLFEDDPDADPQETALVAIDAVR